MNFLQKSVNYRFITYSDSIAAFHFHFQTDRYSIYSSLVNASKKCIEKIRTSSVIPFSQPSEL